MDTRWGGRVRPTGVLSVQPAAGRLHLPYTVLLAVIGVAVGGLASFLRYTPLTSLFDEIVAPVVNLPFNGFGRQPPAALLRRRLENR